MSYITRANTTYTYDTSGRLIRENYTETNNDFSSNSRDILYLYDESGIVGAVQTYNGTTETFYFDRNIKGDVIGIYNASGTRIAKYSYDSWGNAKLTTLSSNNFSAYNPIRYRGYYYDAESGLYFLNARYYNPTWRRFISPDDTAYLDPETPNGLNLYAYCNNDPVNFSDPSGCFAWGAILAGAVIGGIIGAGFEIANQIKTNGWDSDYWDIESIGTALLNGAISGAIGAIDPSSLFKRKVWAYVFTFLIGASGALIAGALTGTINFNNPSEVVFAIAVGGISNVIGKAISDSILKRQTSKIMNLSRKKKSLTIQQLEVESGNIKAGNGSARNSFKNCDFGYVKELIIKTSFWIKNSIYSTSSASLISGIPDIIWG